MHLIFQMSCIWKYICCILILTCIFYVFSFLLFFGLTTSLFCQLTYKGNSNIDEIGLWNDQKPIKFSSMLLSSKIKCTLKLHGMILVVIRSTEFLSMISKVSFIFIPTINFSEKYETEHVMTGRRLCKKTIIKSDIDLP